MKRNLLLNIMILLLFTSCSSQNERIENKLMECWYESYADNGYKLKKLFSNYQKLLVKEKVFLDSTAKSYRNYFQNIADNKEFEHVPCKSFLEEIKKIAQPNRHLIQECTSLIIKDSSNYDLKKLYILENAFSSVQNSGDLQPSLVAEEILSVLSEEDFELDYYRLRTLFLFDILNMVYGNDNKLRTAASEVIEYDLTDVLKISTNEKDEIFANGQKVNIEQLKKKVKDYTSKNKNKAVISISTSRKTRYRTYIDVQNTITSAIQNLRDKSAIKEYKLEFENLTEKQKKSIKNIYPIEIVKTKPE